MKTKKEKIKETIKFLKTPKGKMSLFFGFYIVFFAVLALLFQISESKSSTEQKKEKSFPFYLNNIERRNFHFKYSYQLDENSHIYEGDRNKDKELFSYNNKDFYKNDNIYLTNNSGVWVKDEDPYIMSEFVDITKIISIAKKAKFISKTTYESGMNVYTYHISTTTLVKLLGKENIDLDDPVNEIIFKTDEKNEVNNIKYDLTSYSKYKNISKNNCKIELEYSKFGKIKEIEDPE
ncbi:MAG: hypothetical protein IJF92_03625 [Bacilli bacterium]|nr:hypothetical protein [Bacilli bacterium]